MGKRCLLAHVDIGIPIPELRGHPMIGETLVHHDYLFPENQYLCMRSKENRVYIPFRQLKLRLNIQVNLMLHLRISALH